MQNKASGDAAHDVFSRDVRIVPLIPDGLHDVLKTVVGDAGLDVIADELSPGKAPASSGPRSRRASMAAATACGRLCDMVVALRSLATGSPLNPFCHSQHLVYATVMLDAVTK